MQNDMQRIIDIFGCQSNRSSYFFLSSNGYVLSLTSWLSRKNHLVHLCPTSFIHENYVQPPQQNFSRTPMHLVSRPFRIFSKILAVLAHVVKINTGGCSMTFFPLCGLISCGFRNVIIHKWFHRSKPYKWVKKKNACHKFEPRRVHFRSLSQWHQCRLY